MKEIKFRAWDKKNNKMGNVFNLDIGYPRSCISVNYNNDEHHLETDDCELMQYTGLKDKSGKEIYEGDIVKIGNYGKREVKWYKGCFGEFNPTYFNPLYIYDMKKVEVVGNIYENPELLK